jgi:hypothetical protein
MWRRHVMTVGAFDHVRQWAPALLMLAGLLLLTVLIVVTAPGS